MPQPTVTALKPLIYQGRSYVRGDRFQVVAVEGLAMARRGEVTLVKGAVLTRDVEAESAADVVETSRPTRRYRRRDMTAEQA